ncbi:cytochrome-c peroxidase [Planctomicrobium piriforme]|uniref:Cytochrome c peroxidase n=1 Tax=Planctomicrobium piriforme TaxID=1576369 RepID=A0A1I3CHE1_9PLAN|nr:cytochrome c peroxidase [Planctomicrobium piriforme]SFH73907.1 cytochrome c peroxidase [Planctomicrobium piriforme]
MSARIQWIAACLVALSLVGPYAATADDALDRSKLVSDAQAHFASLTPLTEEAKQKIGDPLAELGRKLFFDPRMSADGVWSCMLCHQPMLYGTDAQALSRGVFDKFLPRNAPTVLNSTLQFKAHWDGRFESVEAQAAHALLGPGFGNKDNVQAMDRIKRIPGYTELFHQVFPQEEDPVTPANYGVAVGAYERTLLTPSRFDEFLDGRQDALTPAEQKGLRLFIDAGCVNCHSGVGVGGHSFEKFGEVSDYWLATKSLKIDAGRFDVTKNEADKYVFKVPSLRNVTQTPPYFHDGSVSSMSDAVRIMAQVQLGADLSNEDAESISSFLSSLKGELPANFTTTPVLPPWPFQSSATTDQ